MSLRMAIALKLSFRGAFLCDAAQICQEQIWTREATLLRVDTREGFHKSRKLTRSVIPEMQSIIRDPGN
jgi:hypothetical protein